MKLNLPGYELVFPRFSSDVFLSILAPLRERQTMPSLWEPLKGVCVVVVEFLVSKLLSVMGQIVFSQNSCVETLTHTISELNSV